MFQMLGVFSEFERSMIQERVKAGLCRARAAAEAKGAYTILSVNTCANTAFIDSMVRLVFFPESSPLLLTLGFKLSAVPAGSMFIHPRYSLLSDRPAVWAAPRQG